MKKLFTLTSFLLASVALQAQWLQQNTGFTTANRGIRDISIVSPTVAWAVAYDGSGLNGNVQDYTRTTNGGTTWTAGTISAPGITGFNNANISALDANTAWVALYGAAGGGRIYHTANGGTSWTQQNTTGYTGASSFLNVVHFFDPLNGVSLGDPEGGWHEVYTTQNGGTTWTRVPQANMPALVAADEYGVIDMYSAIGDTIWFGTVYGRVFKSVNKGLNWSAYTTGFTGNATTYAMDDIEFLNGNDGLVKNGTTLRRTTDGGLTWTAVASSGSVFTTDLGPVKGTPESYVSVGTTGSSYTQNAGNNWTTINTTQYNKVAFINPTTGWAGGFSTATGTGGIFKWNGPTLLPTADLSLASISSPGTTLCNATAGLVCVVITNTGTIPQSNFQISYSINGGTPVTANYTATVQPGANASYCFSPPASFPTPGAYTVSATVSLTGDMDAANNTTTKTVTSVVPAPVTVSGAGAVCPGQSATLSASGANTYTWQPGNLTGSTITVSPTANTTYTVTGSTGTSCNATATAAVTVSATPAIAATASPATVCAGQSAVLSASGGVSYSWLGTPGGTTNTLTVSPTTPTTYSVTGTNANGCTATGTVQVGVSNGPALAVSATPSSVCPGEPVTLSVSGGSSYSWFAGAQTTNTITANPTASTTYSVSGTDAFGCSATASAMVIVSSAPTISVTAAQMAICPGESLELTAAGGATYSWHDAGQTTALLTVSPTATTTYSITAQTSSGCVGTGALTVTVNPVPQVSISPAQDTICAGQSVALTGAGAQFSYSWVSPGPIIGPPVPTLVATPLTTTTYTLYGYDVNQGCAGMATATVTVNPTPQVVIGNNPSPICAGTSIALSAVASGNVTYSWAPNAGPGIPDPVLIISPAGTATYTVFVTDGNGCTGTDAVTVTVNPVPATPVITGPAALCTGDTLDLCITGNYPTGTTFSWTHPNNLTGTTQCITVNGVGQADQGLFNAYAIENGCISAAGNQQFTVNPLPDAGIQTPVINGNTVTVSAATPGLAGYNWSFAGGTPATANTASATTTFAAAGTYTVSLTTENTSGCIATETLTITISATAEQLQQLVRVYPNPTTGQVQIDWLEIFAGQATVRVLNLLGQEVVPALNAGQGQAGLDLSGLAEGAYAVQITLPSGIVTKQVLLHK